jgi:hypothetical protein
VKKNPPGMLWGERNSLVAQTAQRSLLKKIVLHYIWVLTMVWNISAVQSVQSRLLGWNIWKHICAFTLSERNPSAAPSVLRRLPYLVTWSNTSCRFILVSDPTAAPSVRSRLPDLVTCRHISEVILARNPSAASNVRSRLPDLVPCRGI